MLFWFYRLGVINKIGNYSKWKGGKCLLDVLFKYYWGKAGEDTRL